MLNKLKSVKALDSVRWRMVGVYLLITILALVAISGTVTGLLEEFLVSQRTQTQLQATIELAERVAADIYISDTDELFSYIAERAQAMGGRILVLDSDSVVQVDTASRQNGSLLPYREVREVLREGSDSAYGFHYISRGEDEGIFSFDEESIWAVYYTVPLVRDGAVSGAVMFSSSIQDVVDSIAHVTQRITLTFAIVIIAMVIVVSILSGWLTRPIAELTSAIRRMGTQGYVRVNVKGSSEITELGQAFNRMSERIEEHDRTRNEFVANASHELKTPLATMKLLSETILYQDDPDPALMKEFFGDINHEVDRLTCIVSELLKLVQEDSSAGGLNFETIRLDNLVRGVCGRLTALAENKNITLTTNLEPVEMQGDGMRLEQIVVNLVENAIKYTDEGSVQVSVADEGEWAVFTVKDTGIGIPEESIEHLFERFYRVDKARSRSTGGTGLGLSITEKLVSLHGGSIEVKSKPGEGSTFTVQLPIKQKGGQANDA
ncbi:MAG: HAMP domain-containing sensor histidine kinase [Clostridia bacterium]|nr:HAMP domain-containing sensor histidine kinase [Clostridia bacterium]